MMSSKTINRTWDTQEFRDLRRAGLQVSMVTERDGDTAAKVRLTNGETWIFAGPLKVSTTLAQFEAGSVHPPAGALIHSFHRGVLKLAEMPDETWPAPEGATDDGHSGWFCTGDGLGTHEWRLQEVVTVEFGVKGAQPLDAGIW